MDILDHNAEAFCRLSSVLGQMIAQLDLNIKSDTRIMAGSLGELQREVQRLNMPFVERQLERVKEHFLSGPATTASLVVMVKEVYQRLLDTLEERAFVAIPTEHTDLYRQQQPMFGAEVDDAFPNASEDISEAGKCLALGRATASVFHLMRAMEICVQVLAQKLGVTNVDRVWGNLLSDMNQKIEGLPRGEERNRWSEAHALLYHVKQAWRNDTMHPKQTYTLEEASSILSSVKAFTIHLAKLS